MKNQETTQALDPVLSVWARTNEERDANRITSDEIAALKHADHKARGSAFTMTALFTAMIRDFISAFGALLHVPTRKTPMCDNYGCVADVSKWKDHLPKCSDCGREIKQRTQLRKSVPHK